MNEVRTIRDHGVFPSWGNRDLQEPDYSQGDALEINGFGSIIYGNPYRLAFIREADAQLAKRLERLEGAIVATTPTGETRDQLVKIRRQVVELRNALETINRPEKLSRTFSFGSAPVAATATSSINLNLGTIPLVAATLTSTEEVNTTATSFTPFGPDWPGFGTSTATATIGGTYDGSNGTGTLDFRVVEGKGGTHGVDDLSINVYDPNDTFIEEIQIKKDDPINQLYTLSNGLTVTLSAGVLVDSDDFTVDVDATEPTSFTPPNPIWTGAVSSAEATIGGVYDGSNGSGTLRFKSVLSFGVHGVDDLRVEVFDPTDTKIQDINILKTDPLNKVYTLNNGLTFTLGIGDLLKNDEFTITVSSLVGSAVDPSKPFNGTRNNNPNFQSGLSVTAGSFDVNGETITVLATDTINSILSKINASSAGVTATFNSQTEKILLTQNTSGSSPTIVVNNDTSGFLAATKLAGATVVPGMDGANDPDGILSSTSRFATVSSGSILINGESIAIDIGNDSLNDVLANITASNAGVTASLINGGQKISIVATSLTDQVVLDGNGTGFFTASEITETTYNPTEGQLRQATRKGLTARHSQQLTRSLREVANTLNPIFDEERSAGRLGPSLSQLRANLKGAIVGSTGSNLNTDFGVHFHFGRSTNKVFDFSRTNQDQLTASLQREPDAAHALLFTDNGLIQRLLAVTQQAEEDLNAALGSTGTFVDVFA